MILFVDSEGPDKTAWMHRLIWVFAVRICLKTSFLMARPILYFEGWAQDYSNSNIFLKPLFRGNLDPFVNNANLGATAHMSNGT